MTKTCVYRVFGLLNVLLLGSCGGLTGAIEQKINAAPVRVSYSSNPAEYVKNLEIEPNRPRVDGGQAERFKVTPALPSGLSIDESTGIISGAPAVQALNSNHQITAINRIGDVSTEIEISIYPSLDERPPGNITYESSPADYVMTVQIEPNHPSSDKGLPSSFTIQPDLPKGLELDDETGVISGNPEVTSSEQLYKVIAKNRWGESEGEVSIRVRGLSYAPLGGFVYRKQDLQAIRGYASPTRSPEFSAGIPTSFEISPDLPNGMTIDPTSGIISGTPAETIPETTFEVTASNFRDSTSTTVRVRVYEILEIDLNDTHACATLSNGSSFCWGRGALGNGEELVTGTPVKVIGLPSQTKGTFTGSGTSCAIVDGDSFDDGELWCWGEPYLGNGTANNSLFPVFSGDLIFNDLRQMNVAVGNKHTCFITQFGRVYCFGENDKGQLGDGTNETSLIPSQVSTIDDAIDVGVSLRVNLEASCAVLATGKVNCWGENRIEGLLGNDSQEASNIPVSVLDLDDAVAMDMGSRHACARRTGGQIKCWGSNLAGRLGTGSNIPAYSRVPLDVVGISNATQLSVGAEHSCARLADSTVKCWGYGPEGELGLDRTASNTPLTIDILPPVKQVVAGADFTCALLEAGTIQCWGWSFHNFHNAPYPGENWLPATLVWPEAP